MTTQDVTIEISQQSDGRWLFLRRHAGQDQFRGWLGDSIVGAFAADAWGIVELVRDAMMAKGVPVSVVRSPLHGGGQ